MGCHPMLAPMKKTLSPNPSQASARGESLLNRAKALRQNQTQAEQLMWHHLRAHRFMGLKFKRQKTIGYYIVDFVCSDPPLIVELDGGQHASNQDYDQRRAHYLQSLGFTVLRFWNHDVLCNTPEVLEVIRQSVCAQARSCA
jgi:very-short-patch-repair endonuclease